MILSGIFPAITTPFYPDGRLYLKKVEHNVDRYSRTPVAGMVVLGSTGEAVMLSDEEQRQVLKTARDSARDEKVLVAGVGQESAAQTLALAEFAAAHDFDVALVRTPSYYRPQMRFKPESILAHYRFIADRSPLPVLLYSVPVFTAYDLPVEAVAELATHPNIIGIKESSGNVEKIAALTAATRASRRTFISTETFAAVTRRMSQPPMIQADEAGAVGKLISAGALTSTPLASTSGSTAATIAAPPRLKMKTRSREVSFQICAGAAQSLLPSLQAGASAAVLAFAAAAPTACFEVYAAMKDGTQRLAEEKQARITTAAIRLAELGVPAIKYACDLNGYYGGPARLPLLPLTATEKSEIESLMRDLRN